MAYEKAAEIFDISRSLFRYLWLEYPRRTKGEAIMHRNGVRGRGLKRKASWLPLPVGVWYVQQIHAKGQGRPLVT